MNLPTAVILLALITAVALVVRKMIRDKKMGKGCCGCSTGGCSGCMGAGAQSMEAQELHHKDT